MAEERRTQQTTNGINGNQGGNRNRGATFRKLSDEEMQDNIKKGLCFRCDEQFGPNHVCINKQLHMLLITGEEILRYEEILDDKKGKEEGDDKEERVLQLSMFTRPGLTTKNSFKVWGRIENEKVVVLLDCGASHNFISKILLLRGGLEPEETLPYVVEVGDGHKVQSKESVRV